MLRRLYHDQPESFAFTAENREWAEAQMTKFPESRQASAVIPLLWRAQEQEGWLSRPAIEEVARMLDMAYIRVLEVATFYFMFQLQPVGSVAHIQVCGTTSCMICGAEDLMAVCRDKIAKRPHQISDDGKFSWEEVECLGACANAPMVQIGKDYYEDLTEESFANLLDRFAAGEVPAPGSQQGRFASEPKSGLTSLDEDAVQDANASNTLARDLADTIKRIDGSEVPIRTPWRDLDQPGAATPPPVRDDLLGPKGGIDEPTPGAQPAADKEISDDGITKQEAEVDGKGRPEEGDVAEEPAGEAKRGEIRAAGETDETVGSERERLGDGSGPLSGEASGSTAPGLPEAGDTAASQETRVLASDERQPQALDAPRSGTADDLKRINGIGPKLEESLNGIGIYHIDQIAEWSPHEVAWIDRNLEGFKGRASRDDWTGQARKLTQGGETES
ncbi:NADH-quinone oxidoreductase subunit E [Palleronia sp. LCG004]|uniref:NADH-quinone oxidoreductase subunit E n=1 Tax=Palleronia sp. LCG004 TaxID=3079304 RepID=UPI002941C087|nr:NADH-quinone oxidoreductase subunit E [Palleronia sp. LCG004]WOI54899.1 NADH-quinone oxidoreductase subunit E [Palleronia sp. LCG004]